MRSKNKLFFEKKQVQRRERLQTSFSLKRINRNFSVKSAHLLDFEMTLILYRKCSMLKFNFIEFLIRKNFSQFFRFTLIATAS
jgi:hypothetical protein